MKRLNPENRILAFKRTFPKYCAPFIFNNRIYGIWIIGALYRRRSGYYGEYPHKLKERILSMFPDCKKIMHLFSGTIQDDKQSKLDPTSEIMTFDIKPEFNPTICDDIRNVKDYSDIFKELDLVIADPPYEAKDFERYKVKPFNKAQVIRDLGNIMKSGSYLAWLDVIVPIYSKKVWELYGHIAIIVSTNTRVRMWSIWRHT